MWGWQRETDDATWTPNWTTLPEAANACHELLKCGCKKSCKNRCECVKRTSSVRCCAPVEDTLMDRFEPSHSKPAWVVQRCSCNISSYYGLNRNVFSGKSAAPVVNLRYFTLKLLFFNTFARKYYCITFEMCLIAFLDLINIYAGTKISKIGVFIAKLQAHPVSRAAIFNFEFLARKPRATIWFPPFFNSTYPKNSRRKFLCFYPEVHAKFTYPPH